MLDLFFARFDVTCVLIVFLACMKMGIDIVLFFLTGIRKFMRDIEMMIGKRNFIFWSYYLPLWCAITPIAIVVGIQIHSFILFSTVYNRNKSLKS